MSHVLTHQLENPTDKFLAARLPDWLRQASAASINMLRDCYASYRDSHDQLTAALQVLPSPQQYALTALQPMLEGAAADVGLARLDWLEVRRRFSSTIGIGLPNDEPYTVRTPALARLMHNFAANESFYVGSGLARSGQTQVLTRDVERIVSRRRQLDVGKDYQALLVQHDTPAIRQLLASHKRASLRLAVEVATLRGQLSAAQQQALRVLAGSAPQQHPQGLHAYAGQLKVLQVEVHDSLLIQLRGHDGHNHGVVLYLPTDPEYPLRHFADVSALAAALATQLAEAAARQRIVELVRLQDRARFLDLLNTRLKDPVPDLALEGATLPADIFARLAEAHIERLKNDARLLLVSNADADASASHARLAFWEGVAMGAAGIAGLFVPVLGQLLLAQMVVQTLGDVYEGVADWAQGHRHEAVEHLLGVAEVVAVTAITAAGIGVVARGFARSGFVDALEPVVGTGGQARLWRGEVEPFEVSPGEGLQLQEDGLFDDDGRRLVRLEGRYYEVHRPDPDRPLRLRHPSRANAYEPVLLHNGERGWRLHSERPLEWDDSVKMLDRLWPCHPALAPSRAMQILQVAGVDAAALRGLLVENSPLPFTLRDTLQRFAADERVSELFANLRQAPPRLGDSKVLAWCRQQADLAALSEEQIAARLLAQPAHWRAMLVDWLSTPSIPADPLLALLERDFPRLPRLYAGAVLEDLSPQLRRVAELEGKLPLSLMTKARSMLQLARTNRAIEGLFLQGQYTAATGELVFAILRRLPRWPLELNLELREGTEHGPLLTTLNPAASEQTRTTLVERQGRFSLYDHRGLPLEVEVQEPAGLFEALVALLSPHQRSMLALPERGTAAALRERAKTLVPATRQGVLNLLGWRMEPASFNPAIRLGNGRLGYPLGGRQSTHRTFMSTLRDRVRALYPGFNNDQVESFMRTLLLQEGSPLDRLLSHEHNLELLDQSLTTWQDAARGQLLRSQRMHVANQLRAAWRLIGEVVVEADGTNSMRLNISGWRIGSLPSLSAQIDMSHVSELVLAGLDLEDVPADFLRCFNQVRSLSLINNRLTHLPEGLSHLTRLRSLNLMANRISMNPSNQNVLSGLARVESLNLSHNPLRSIDLRFAQPSQLRELNLTYCSLVDMPSRLAQCQALEVVQLSSNLFSTIPEELMQLPWRFRARINLSNTRIPRGAVTAFHSAGQRATLVREQPSSLLRVESWLLGEPNQVQEALAQRWSRVQSQDGSSGLFRLLQALTASNDFAQAGEYVRGQVWALLEALDTDAALREQIFASAHETLGCVDSVAERFSRLQIEVLTYKARQRTGDSDAGPELLDLGRRLFRLEQLDRFAFAAVDRRRAAGEAVDDLEVVLGYRVELADELGLPCQPRTIRFRTLAGITPACRAEALSAVLAAQTPEAVAQSVASQAFWTDFLRSQHPGPFSEVADTFAARGEALENRAENLSSEAYRQAWEALAAEREAAMHSLELQLTRDALG
ncbi:NEL-type E3 ubiquitin ligase domain-containing protein [Pseudomonas mosselii]